MKYLSALLLLITCAYGQSFDMKANQFRYRGPASVLEQVQPSPFLLYAGNPATVVASTATTGQLPFSPPPFLAKCMNAGVVVDCNFTGGDATSFDMITSGTNTNHGLVCGSGCVISPTNGGFVSANEFNGVPFCSGFTPTNGQNLQYSTALSPNPCYTAVGAAVIPPTIRGSAMQASNATSFTVTWPTGTIAGDEAYIFLASSGSLNGPATGWTQLQNVSGGSYAGQIYQRVLNSADIATGSVAVSNNFPVGNCAGIVSLVGQSGGARLPISSAILNTTSPVVVTTDGSPLTTDLVLYVGCNELGAGTNITSSLGTKLQQTGSQSASGAIYAGSPASNGGVSPSFSWTGAGTPVYAVTVALKGK